MGCLSFEYSLFSSAKLAVTAVTAVGLTVTPASQPVLTVRPVGQAEAVIRPVGQASLAIRPVSVPSLSIGSIAVVGNSLVIHPRVPGLTVVPKTSAELGIRPSASQLSVTPKTSAEVAVAPAAPAELRVRPVTAMLTLTEVCAITSGEIYVLAASDGPLRQPDGGYFLLDPDDIDDSE